MASLDEFMGWSVVFMVASAILTCLCLAVIAFRALWTDAKEQKHRER